MPPPRAVQAPKQNRNCQQNGLKYQPPSGYAVRIPAEFARRKVQSKRSEYCESRTPQHDPKDWGKCRHQNDVEGQYVEVERLESQEKTFHQRFERPIGESCYIEIMGDVIESQVEREIPDR